MCHWNIMVTHSNALLQEILQMTLKVIIIFYLDFQRCNLDDWQPKIIVFNKACKIESLRVSIPTRERSRLKSCHMHIDVALYHGKYPPCPASDVLSFRYTCMVREIIAKTNRSELLLYLPVWASIKDWPTFDILLGDCN